MSKPFTRDLDADQEMCDDATALESWPKEPERFVDGPCDDVMGWHAVGPLHDSWPGDPEDGESKELAERDQRLSRMAREALPLYIAEVRRLQERERTLSILADQVSRIRELVSLSTTNPGPEQGETLDAIDRILRE